jgi:hypothetical protein
MAHRPTAAAAGACLPVFHIVRLGGQVRQRRIRLAVGPLRLAGATCDDEESAAEKRR